MEKVPKFLEILTSVDVVDFFVKMNIDLGYIEKLKELLLSCSAEVDDAERKQIGDPDARTWLSDLKHVMDGVEDLVRDINNESLSWKQVREYYIRRGHCPKCNHMSTATCRCSKFNSKSTAFNVINMAEVIEQRTLGFVKGLESLLKRKDDLNLKGGPPESYHEDHVHEHDLSEESSTKKLRLF
ncbi:hypothetical protein FNV43_RR22255 [Rhamnella rubrinervis]|uniref:Disease resistance N-terminal domain-containing protein n=1 Tax=Rhamnella rubrinervis TaxID=2594499 RepID=A0A8K0DVU9_9ROSA|nr:hypothetical protein FNV43_RR22255 [Rhamnella rubrinervis]